jgi:CRISPR-associated protein Cmr4
VLLFPVRSLRGCFVWALCPYVVERLRRDLGLVSGTGITLPANPLSVTTGGALVSDDSVIGRTLVLEDDEYSVDPSTEMGTLTTALAAMLPPRAEYAHFHDRLAAHVVLVNDTDFTRLVTNGTEVVTRNKLNDRKTTTGGGGNMWVEEYVPSDTFFYSVVLAMPSRSASPLLPRGADIVGGLTALVNGKYLQIGGDETVGRGWMRFCWV